MVKTTKRTVLKAPSGTHGLCVSHGHVFSGLRNLSELRYALKFLQALDFSLYCIKEVVREEET